VTETEVVYVVGSPKVRPVKIGRSTDVMHRLAAMQAASPVPLHLLWVVAGGSELESALHSHFRRERLHGEWFDLGRADAVDAVIEALAVLIDYSPTPQWISAQKANWGRVNANLDKVRTHERKLRIALEDAKVLTVEAMWTGFRSGVKHFRSEVQRRSPFSPPVVRALADAAGLPPDERYVREFQPPMPATALAADYLSESQIPH
jgi:hypothetical protein